MIGRSRRSLTPPHLLLKGLTVHVWGGESGGGISPKTRMNSSSSSCGRYPKQVFLGTYTWSCNAYLIVASNQFVFNSIHSFILTSTLGNLAKNTTLPIVRYVCIPSNLYIQVSQHLMHSAFSLCCLLAVCGVIGARTIRRLCDTMPTCMQYACVCVIAVATYMYLKGVLATLHI